MSVIHPARAVVHPDPHAVNHAARGEDHRASVRHPLDDGMHPLNQVAQRKGVVLNPTRAANRTLRAQLIRRAIQLNRGGGKVTQCRTLENG